MTGTERKVFQKYYPPDFDPAKIPRAKMERNRQFVQRVMIPYNMQCNTCGEYIYKGKKFNMRRETAEGEFYLGLRIFRFYVRCPNCLAELTFKTDLENTDYAPEHGHTRLFDAAKIHIMQKKAEAAKEEAEAADPMKMLEKRTKMSRAEMEALGMLEELKEESKRAGAVSIDKMVGMVTDAKAKAAQRAVDEDEAFIDQVFGKPIKAEDPEDPDAPAPRPQRVLIKRLQDSDEDDDPERPGPSSSAASGDLASGPRLLPAFTNKPPHKRAKDSSVGSLKASMASLVKLKAKPAPEASAGPSSSSQAPAAASKPSSSALPLIGAYSSSSDEDQ